MKRRSKIVVCGAGGHGKVVADTALAAGFEVIGFCDDDHNKREQLLLGRKIIAIGLEEIMVRCLREKIAIALGVGSNQARKKLYEAALSRGLEVLSIIHPSAVIAPSVSVGRGVVVFANVVVNSDSVVEDGVILNTSCSVDHDNYIGSFAHLSPGVHLGGTVKVGQGTHVGIGSSIRNNINIGAWCVVGAGAAVVSDVPDGSTVVGVPAKPIK